MREAIERSAIEKSKVLTKWSMNDEFLHRINQSFSVPEDVAIACAKMPDVKDRLDFAVRVLTDAGMVVSLPKKK